ncbi:MAG: hypothetical protein ACRERU_11535 [Methylococcales bacterium]
MDWIPAIHAGMTMLNHLYNQVTPRSSVGSIIFEGIDFNHDQDGIWWKVTTQLVAAWWPMVHSGSESNRTTPQSLASKYQGELRKAQKLAPHQNGKGIVATIRDKLTTGFDLPTGEPWYYFNRLHIGATAWFIFAEQPV